MPLVYYRYRAVRYPRAGFVVPMPTAPATFCVVAAHRHGQRVDAHFALPPDYCTPYHPRFQDGATHFTVRPIYLPLITATCHCYRRYLIPYQPFAITVAPIRYDLSADYIACLLLTLRITALRWMMMICSAGLTGSICWVMW